jgi:hypothetical protein
LKSVLDAIIAFHNVSWRHVQCALSIRDVSVLRQLQADIDTSLAQLREKTGGDKTGAFVRLCGRSPKDGEPLDRAAVLRKYQKEHANLEKVAEDLDDLEKKMLAIARTQWMQVSDGDGVMSLLLTSERVYSDMLDWQKFG